MYLLPLSEMYYYRFFGLQYSISTGYIYNIRYILICLYVNSVYFHNNKRCERMPGADYMEEKKKMQRFFREFYLSTTGPQGPGKLYKYLDRITSLAHRDAVELIVDLDDIIEFDADLADSIRQNARRYQQLFSEVVFEMLPEFRTR